MSMSSQSCHGNESNSVNKEGNVAPSSVSENQLVLYDPKGNETEEEGAEPNQSQTSSHKTQCPSIGAFTVQCATCLKWRLMPSMEKYEEIREQILEKPFYCETACEWKANVTCDVAEDISQDGTRVWAIDRPSISRPPAGWQRQLRIRGEGGTKFADVYVSFPPSSLLVYMSQFTLCNSFCFLFCFQILCYSFRKEASIECGGPKVSFVTALFMIDYQFCFVSNLLDSTLVISSLLACRYLNENPEYITQGVKLSQFSFQIPKPLRENYVRKRPARPMEPSDAPVAIEGMSPPPPDLFYINCFVESFYKELSENPHPLFCSFFFSFSCKYYYLCELENFTNHLLLFSSFFLIFVIVLGNVLKELCFYKFSTSGLFCFFSANPLALVSPDAQTPLQPTEPGLCTHLKKARRSEPSS